MDLIALLKLVLFLSVFAVLVSVTLIRLTQLNRKTVIKMAGAIGALLVAGMATGSLSTLNNGWVTGLFCFSLAALFLMFTQTWTHDSGDFHGRTKRNILSGILARNFASVFVLIGVLIAPVLVLLTDDTELQLLALGLPFLCGAFGLVALAGAMYRELGIVLLVFLVMAPVAVMTTNHFETVKEQKLAQRIEAADKMRERQELHTLLRSDHPDSLVRLFQKSWDSPELLCQKSQDDGDRTQPVDDKSLVACLQEKNQPVGTWKIRLGSAGQLIATFSPNLDLEIKVINNGELSNQLSGTYSLTEGNLELRFVTGQGRTTLFFTIPTELTPEEKLKS